MKKSMLASLLLTMSGAGAEAPAAPTTASAAVPPLRARLTEDVIRSAVRDTLAQDRTAPDPALAGRVLSGGGYRTFAQAVADSKTPSCFGEDALKFQPSEHDTKNWHFGATGTMATPFWIAAVVRGKCR
jgi:hypothetical protein